MDKFDLVYEKLTCAVNEREYIDSTFQDNLMLLLKVLQDNDFLNPELDLKKEVEDLLKQQNNVKEIVLDLEHKGLPPVKLQMKQESDSETFSVTVINVNEPEEQKRFNNTMLETIFDDVVSYIESIALKGIEPQAAVNELPQEQNPANQQPGGGETALPDTD